MKNYCILHRHVFVMYGANKKRVDQSVDMFYTIVVAYVKEQILFHGEAYILSVNEKVTSVKISIVWKIYDTARRLILHSSFWLTADWFPRALAL